MEHMVPDSDLLRKTIEVVNPLITAAKTVVKYFQDYDNDIIPEYAFIQACSSAFIAIRTGFKKMSELPIPSIRLNEWSSAYDQLAGTIDDMQLIYSPANYSKREEKDRRILMNSIINRYYEDLRRIGRLEESLKL